MNEKEIRPECTIRFNEQEKDIDSLKRSMFGPDGLGGVLGCIKEKVSKKGAMKISIGIASIIAVFIIAGMTSWGDANERISNNKTDISVIQSELAHIKTTTDKIEKNQIKTDEFLKEIRKIIIGGRYGSDNDTEE